MYFNREEVRQKYCNTNRYKTKNFTNRILFEIKLFSEKLFPKFFDGNNKVLQFFEVSHVEFCQIQANFRPCFLSNFTLTRRVKNFEHLPEQKCWKCNRIYVDKRTCDFCRTIQPLSSHTNYFDYLDLPPTFELNATELKNHFRRIQTIIHPDKFAKRDVQEMSLSNDHSAYLNNAYRSLKDPVTRADYLIKLLQKGNEIYNTFVR